MKPTENLASVPSTFTGAPDCEVDARGLSCPLPILRAKKALSGMDSGQILRITATDPGSASDFPSFSRQTGNALLAQGEDETGVYWFVLKRK